MGALVINGQKVAGVNIEIKPEIYSTEEREVGVWTDGKPLYEKTIAIDAPSSDETTINHNISNADYIYVKEGTLTKTGNGTTPYETYHSSSSWACGIYNVSRTSFTLFVGSSLRTYVNGGFITFRYTKTTDEPGSGTWTTEGVYAHHYSTDEHIVGTYEGETLYEKNIDITLADSSDMQTFAPGTLGIGSIKVIIDSYFKNSGGQQLRMSTWYGNNYWSYIVGSNGGIMIKRNTSDPNWTTDVHFVATVQYTKSS